MVPVVGVAHVALAQVRIDLGRRDVRVAQQGLDGAEVGAALDQVGRKAVSELVRGHRTSDARSERVLPEALKPALAREPTTPAVQEHVRVAACKVECT